MADEPTSSYYNHRVRFVSVRNLRDRVEFKVTPTFREGRSVEYTPVTPIHMPGSIQVYKNTASRTFGIGAKLVSRNPNEAYENMTLLQKLRTWTLPFFGASTTLNDTNRASRNAARSNEQASNTFVGPVQATQQEKAANTQRQLQQDGGVELLGAPPMVLYLYAYSSSINDTRTPDLFPRVNINRVPVVITNLSIDYPNDVDYLPASSSGVDGIGQNTESFPTRMDVSVDCVETHSPREYEKFSLQDFHDGKLVSF